MLGEIHTVRMLIEPNHHPRNTQNENGSQMSENTDDIEYVMARIYTMKEAKKNLDREIRQDEKYLAKIMGDKEELKTPSFTASRKSFTRKSVVSLDDVIEILGDEVAEQLTRVSEVSYVSIAETLEDFEPYMVENTALLPDWARRAYIMLQVEEAVEG